MFFAIGLMFGELFARDLDNWRKIVLMSLFAA